ncbi:MAG: histidine ammonia-lyase [Alicyclobacillus herbarius]|uniref:histidine ammonia-lyase n=1 Tax=Alicyclobacillus herbarius TaxID=122960 RepID=UPI0023520751|nr:histidine ammonia-lyase [Alicyclobacillus herbarius]MCL6631509.1 histidine ammonia-lyase [Alicyclobacillus herbarius]
MQERKVMLDGQTLTPEMVMEVVAGAQVEVTDAAWERVRASRARIEEQVQAGRVVYGVTTGFGKLADVRIDGGDLSKLQVNLLRSHAVGVGQPLSTDVVRAMLTLRANALAKGFSGIREETLRLLVEMVNRRVHPVIPSQGSLGASGDLAPLAHMALVLIGEGKAEFHGRVLPGAEALAKAGLKPVELMAKEGLALINGTQAMTAIGVLALTEAVHVGLAADAALALTMEALEGIADVFDEELLRVRPHKEFLAVAGRLRQWLAGSQRVSRQGILRVQDAYSLRCGPQVHGSSWQTIEYVRDRVLVEINSATDNPIVLEDGRILSGGHFHGQPIAIAMDLLKIGAAEWGNISERRTERMVNPQLSGLPAFLAPDPGLQSGFMITQYVAAALVSENKVLAHPASVDSIPSSANQEDHVSMGTIAARQCRQMIHNVAHVIAIEMACAAQAIHLQQAEGYLAPATRNLLQKIRAFIPAVTDDTSLSEPLERLASAILAGEVPGFHPADVQ